MLRPWVENQRHELKQNKHPRWMDYLDCNNCVLTVSKAQRAQWHCGFEPERTWSGFGFPNRPEWPEQPPDTMRGNATCPGYLCRLPQVNEVVQARAWFDKGLLKERFDGLELTGSLMDGIELLESACNDVETYLMRPKDK